MRKSTRQPTPGFAREYTSNRSRKFVKWKRGEGKEIKRELTRATRRQAKTDIRNYMEN